jgi:hypothetical protein
MDRYIQTSLSLLQQTSQPSLHSTEPLPSLSDHTADELQQNLCSFFDMANQLTAFFIHSQQKNTLSNETNEQKHIQNLTLDQLRAEAEKKDRIVRQTMSVMEEWNKRLLTLTHTSGEILSMREENTPTHDKMEIEIS